ncbi:MAG: hypothetical protein U1F66_08115 [bacterium]
MARKFWQDPAVSKMLKKPKQALRKTFRAVRGLKNELEALRQELPQALASIERGIQVLDQGFPIREGNSSIDWIALNPAGELTFVWAKAECRAETVSKLLPDYDWIQKNRALWTHLFPRLLASQSLQMRVWIFALEIDPEVRYLLHYLQGIRIRLFLSGFQKDQGTWSFRPWEELKKVLERGPPLPSSPSLLPVPPAQLEAPPPAERAAPLLSQEELNDLLGVPPGAEAWRQEEEITDPFYELRSDPKLA